MGIITGMITITGMGTTTGMTMITDIITPMITIMTRSDPLPSYRAHARPEESES